MEGETSLGEVKEVAEEVGRVSNNVIKVLPCGGPGGDTLWFGNLGVDGSDDAKYLEGKRGFTAAGDGDEVSKSGGQYLAKGGGG